MSLNFFAASAVRLPPGPLAVILPPAVSSHPPAPQLAVTASLPSFCFAFASVFSSSGGGMT